MIAVCCHVDEIERREEKAREREERGKPGKMFRVEKSFQFVTGETATTSGGRWRDTKRTRLVTS